MDTYAWTGVYLSQKVIYEDMDWTKLDQDGAGG
jgi:hypothetical protein